MPGCAPPKPQPCPATGAGFSDVPASNPACSAIELLVGRKIISGFPNGTFQPNEPITRAQFAKILVLALGLQPDAGESLPFRDVSGHWAAQQGFLQAAVKIGAINGFADGSFHPDASITRAQGIKIVVAANHGPGSGAKQPPGPPSIVYTDVAATDWYSQWVTDALHSAYIGPQATFPLFTQQTLNPAASLTRGEAAQLLANLLLPAI